MDWIQTHFPPWFWIAIIMHGVEDTLIPTPARATDFATTGADWWTRQADAMVQRLGDQLQVSMSLEETLTQTLARLRGTSDNGFKDGLFEKARQDATRLVTTQVGNAVSEAHVAVADANAAAVILEHASVMDTQTSLICTARNGLRYRADTHDGIGHSIAYLSGPPYHVA